MQYLWLVSISKDIVGGSDSGNAAGLVGYSTTRSVLELIGLILVLAVVIAACYFTTRFVGSKQSGITSNSNFKVIDSYRIAQGKVLQIVEVGEKYFVIAVSKDNISFIGEVDSDKINLNPYAKEQGKNFSEILKKITKSDK